MGAFAQEEQYQSEVEYFDNPRTRFCHIFFSPLSKLIKNKALEDEEFFDYHEDDVEDFNLPNLSQSKSSASQISLSRLSGASSVSNSAGKVGFGKGRVSQIANQHSGANRVGEIEAKN